MAFYEEKEKSCEDPFRLESFYFICVLGAPYYQEGCIGSVGEVQIIKINLLTKVPRKLDISGFQTRFQRHYPDMSGRQPGHFWASPYPQQLSPIRTYPAPYPDFREVSQTCLAPTLDTSSLSTLSRVKALEMDMSSS
jgi:hypothetical protein